MNALKIAALCFASACLFFQSADADEVSFEVRIQVRDVDTLQRYSVTVFTTPNETKAKEFRDFLMFLFIVVTRHHDPRSNPIDQRLSTRSASAPTITPNLAPTRATEGCE